MAYDPKMWEGFSTYGNLTPGMMSYLKELEGTSRGHYVGEGDNATWVEKPLDVNQFSDPTGRYTLTSILPNWNGEGANPMGRTWSLSDKENQGGRYGEGIAYKPTGEYWDEASMPNQKSTFMKVMPWIVAALGTAGVGAAVAGAAGAGAAGAGAAGLGEAGTAAALEAASAEALAAGASYEAGASGLMGAYNSLPAWQQAALQGAAKGGISSGVQGENPWKGALMGAITGGAGGAAGSAISGAGGADWMSKLGSMGASRLAGMAAGGLMGGGSGAGPGMMGGSSMGSRNRTSSSLPSSSSTMGGGSIPASSRPQFAPTPEGAFFASTYKPDKITSDFGPYAYAANKLRGG